MYIIETARLGLRDCKNRPVSLCGNVYDSRVWSFSKTLTKEEAREMINRLKQHIAAKGYGFWR